MSRVLPYNAKQWEIPLLLDGRKTVTRRVVKKSQCNGLPKIEPDDWDKECLNEPWCNMPDSEFIKGTYNPPYQPGDILYVRETWGWEPCWDCGLDTEEYGCPYEYERMYNRKKREYGCYCYKASMEEGEELSVDTWHPSIHMPKEAARIWLKVTNVRVERLQQMWASDVSKEGLQFNKPHTADEMLMEFAKLWNSTLRKSDLDRYGWDANPWVWVIEFERCGKPESEG